WLSNKERAVGTPVRTARPSWACSHNALTCKPLSLKPALCVCATPLFLLVLRRRLGGFFYCRHLKTSLRGVEPAFNSQYSTENFWLQHALHQRIGPIKAHLAQHNIVLDGSFSFLRSQVFYFTDTQHERRVPHENVYRSNVFSFRRVC